MKIKLVSIVVFLAVQVCGGKDCNYAKANTCIGEIEEPWDNTTNSQTKCKKRVAVSKMGGDPSDGNELNVMKTTLSTCGEKWIRYSQNGQYQFMGGPTGGGVSCGANTHSDTSCDKNIKGE